MPLLTVKTSITPSDTGTINQLLVSLSSFVSQQLGKPESYVMTIFEGGIPMTFAGTFEPVCYIEVKNIGKMTTTQTKSMSQIFCRQIETTLGVPANRIYIEFSNAEGYLWGWNSTVFA